MQKRVFSNDVLFFIKRRVVFYQTTCCFSSNDVLFFLKRRVVFYQTMCCKETLCVRFIGSIRGGRKIYVSPKWHYFWCSSFSFSVSSDCWEVEDAKKLRLRHQSRSRCPPALPSTSTAEYCNALASPKKMNQSTPLVVSESGNKIGANANR